MFDGEGSFAACGARVWRCRAPARWSSAAGASARRSRRRSPPAELTLPLDPERLTPHMLVGEVVMANEVTAFLAAAQARGCRVQGGTDLLVEMIPPYLEIFGSDDERPSVGAIARL